MTPFAEEVLEIAPAMQQFMDVAKFHDLNHRSNELHARLVRFAQKHETFDNLHLAPGHYWFETSGVNPRYRVGFIVGIDVAAPQELVGSMIIRTPDGETTVMDGLLWVLLSKMRPLVGVLPTEEGKCDVDPTYALLMAACVEAVTQ